MEYITIKRLRLLMSIVCMVLSFGLLIYFIHPIFYIYYKAKAQVIPDYYRRRITKIITEIDDIEDDIKKEVRKKLWSICEDQDFSTRKTKKEELIEEIKEIVNLARLICIIVSFTIMVIAISLTVWYKSNEKNFIIAKEKDKKK